VARYAAIIGLAGLVAGLWVLYAASGDYRVFGGVSTANAVLWAASLATALLLVVAAGRLVFGVGFALLDREATGLQRGIIYSVLTFILVSVILGSLGVNVTAILTTSFLATAIVGLAMQPTLGGLIAGSALQLDRVLHVGDVILLNQERIEVVSLNWRSVVGRKNGNTAVIIPNARIADTQLDILRAGQPVRAEVVVPAAVTAPPHRVAEILSEAVYDLPYVDPALPVTVAPFDYQFIGGFINYRVRFWVRHNYDIAQARAALLARAWYVFQREGIPWRVPVDIARTYDPIRLPGADRFKGLRLDGLAELEISGLRSVQFGSGLSPDLGARVIAACGAPLCYCDGELIVLPRHVEESLFLLAGGELRESPIAAAWHDGPSPLKPWMRHSVQSGRRMAIERIAANLAHHIGPYADHAVREAAAADPNPTAVSAAIAQEIEDPDARENFLRGLQVEYEETHRAGFVFGRQSGAYSRVSSPSLRTVGGAIVIPILLQDTSQARSARRN
jgi:small-conductance mechanosensitive channel